MDKTEPLKTEPVQKHRHRSHRHTSSSSKSKSSKRPLTSQEKFVKKINSLSTINLILFLFGAFVVLGFIFYLTSILFKSPDNNPSATKIASNNNATFVDKLFTKYTISFSQMKSFTLSIISTSSNDLTLGQKTLPKHADFMLNYHNIAPNHGMGQINLTNFPEIHSANLTSFANSKNSYQIKQIPSTFNNITDFSLDCDKFYSNDNMNIGNEMSAMVANYNLNIISSDKNEIINIYKTPDQYLVYSFNLQEKKNYQLSCKNIDVFVGILDNLYSSVLQ